MQRGLGQISLAHIPLVQAAGGEVSNLFGGYTKGNLMAITFNTLAGNGARSLIDHTPFDPEAIFAQITGTFIGQEVGSKLFPNPEDSSRSNAFSVFSHFLNNDQPQENDYNKSSGHDPLMHDNFIKTNQY